MSFRTKIESLSLAQLEEQTLTYLRQWFMGQNQRSDSLWDYISSLSVELNKRMPHRYDELLLQVKNERAERWKEQRQAFANLGKPKVGT